MMKSSVSPSTRFQSEAALVDKFVDELQTGSSCYGSVQVTREWNHRAGLVDVLVRDATGGLVAFEAKLDNWRRAFLQAYRNTAYADRAYVLVPPAVAARALQDREEFELRGVGLCSFDGEAIHIVIEACEQQSLLQWVRVQAHDHFNSLPDERVAHSKSRRRRKGAVRAAAV